MLVAVPRRLLLVLAVALSVPGVAAAAPARGAPPRWAAPVRGEPVRAYSYERDAPFARGAHRGVDLAARAGERVAAPCTGTVTHAGRVPGHARGVTITCADGLVATVLDLRATAVARGARVRRGAQVGAATGPALHVGARRPADAFAYVEPPLAAGTDPPPLVPGRGPRPRPGPAPIRAPRPHSPPTRAPRPAHPPRGIPTPAWAGLALLLAAAPSAR